MPRRATLWVAVVIAGAAIAPGSVAGDDRPRRPSAEDGFARLRQAAAEKDEATLVACLPTKLVEGWTDAAADDGRAWRSDLAAQLAAGSVVNVRESGDAAIARWRITAPASVRELRLGFDGTRWAASAPWAYEVGGGAIAKANGRGAARVKLAARKKPGLYGKSAFSFTHVTQKPEQCKNRFELWFCHNRFLHLSHAMISSLGAKELDDIDGIQFGGDWMDQIQARPSTAYVLHCSSPDRMDFHVAMRVTSCTDDELEFEWRLLAAGRNAPASIRAAQPLVSNDGADGCDGLCEKGGQ